jgi:hypothetical protein
MLKFDIVQTEHEAQVLINLLDIALKTQGLEAAEACLTFAQRTRAAAMVIAASTKADADADKPAGDPPAA